MLHKGTTLQSRYLVKEVLGQGGMGTTYLAEDTIRGKEVALKVLETADAHLLEAFRSEFTLLSRIRHPNLVRVHDFGASHIDGERVFFHSADFIDGPNLAEFAGGRSWSALVSPVGGAIAALAFLHRVGIGHGDIKPDNILVTDGGRGVLIDLGCAQPIGHQRPGRVSGTAGFIPPEAFRGDSNDLDTLNRADLFALGATLQALWPLLDEPPPESVQRLASRLTADDPKQRPSDAMEVLEVLGVKSAAHHISAAPELLDRAEEMEQLDSLLSSLWDGEAAARVLWLQGPSGVGRSRLLREMTWSCQLRGLVVEGLPSERLPVTSMLRRATKTSDLHSSLGSTLDALDLLRDRGEPTVLVLDDVHRLPEHELSLLEALVRLAEPQDPFLILCASIDPLPDGASCAHNLDLAPLTVEAVARWSAQLISATSLSKLMDLTGGFPALVEAFLAEIASGALREDRLGDLGSTTSRFHLPLGQLESLDVAKKRALALIAIRDGFADSDALEGSLVSEETLAALHNEGWVVPEGEGWKLRRAADAIFILDGLDPNLIRGLRSEAAESLRIHIDGLDGDDPSRSELTARLALALTESGLAQEALALLKGFDRRGRALRIWCRVADALAALLEGAEVRLVQAAIHCEAGNPDEGLRALAGPLSRGKQEWIVPISLEAARCALRLGDSNGSLQYLDQAHTGELSPAERAAVADLKARTFIQQGDYEKALIHAQEALGIAGASPFEVAKLHEDIGVAASFMGNAELARTHLREAESLQKEGASPRDRIRLLSYRALNEYQTGNIVAAISAHERALSIAEDEGLSDQTPVTAVNLGTATHQQGDWGRALICYERGLRSAIALGVQSTAQVLRCNLAQLYADIGAYDRADSVLSIVESWVLSVPATPVAGSAASLRAHIDLAGGNERSCRHHLERARKIFLAQSSQRELAELDVELASLGLETGDLEAAQRALDAAHRRAEELDAPDLWASIHLARGRLRLSQGKTTEAMETLQRALELAQRSRQRALEAESEKHLGIIYGRRGAPLLATRHQERSRELWEHVVATLPAHLHDTFWSHPQRNDTHYQGGTTSDKSDPSPPAVDLTHLLQIYRQLSSAVQVDQVLRCTLDAAIELTGAERGFLILRRDDGREALHVPIARNLDREKIGKSHLRFSRSIAEEVIETGEPILTVDALADQRFQSNASVHAMRLRSVISVPIGSGESVLGALYLDNRFERGRFRDRDRSLLLAFADQAAIALTNARLVADLKKTAAQLRKERRKVDALVENQAAQIEELSENLRSRQLVLEHRYDYSAIVGRSASMLQVFSTLDRVIDTNLPVLVQGESGTGKELVARTIHFNGPRKRGPYVTVDCASLTETLLESELFGHVRGAYTGAIRDRKGLFVEAEGGTLFLDELGEIPLGMQAKLLRALQEREIRPVGSEEIIPIDVRLVAATNRRLSDEVDAGRFRQDLFYRVVVVELTLPPLRDRLEDIPDLARHFLKELASDLDRPEPRIDGKALRKLSRFSWPGNIRQLRNVLSRAFAFSEADIRAGDIELPRSTSISRGPRSRNDFEADEGARILAALRAHSWNVSAVSRQLGIPRNTLYRKLRKHGLHRS